MTVTNLLFSFEGRIARLQFWTGMIALTAVELALDAVLGVPILDDPTTMHVRVTGVLVSVVFLYPSLAIVVKRLHDRGHPTRSAWLFVAAEAIVLVGDLLGAFDEKVNLTAIWFVGLGLALAVFIAVVIELGCRSGQAGPNRYGPAPV